MRTIGTGGPVPLSPPRLYLVDFTSFPPLPIGREGSIQGLILCIIESQCHASARSIDPLWDPFCLDACKHGWRSGRTPAEDRRGSDIMSGTQLGSEIQQLYLIVKYLRPKCFTSWNAGLSYSSPFSRFLYALYISIGCVCIFSGRLRIFRQLSPSSSYPSIRS
jgi:hypothetical protein